MVRLYKSIPWARIGGLCELNCQKTKLSNLVEVVFSSNRQSFRGTLKEATQIGQYMHPLDAGV
jgi:hypothetical protein